MRLRPSLDLPFFEDRHRDFFAEVDRVGAEISAGVGAHDDANVDEACRGYVRALGDSGLLRAVGSIQITFCQIRSENRAGTLRSVHGDQAMGFGPKGRKAPSIQVRA